MRILFLDDNLNRAKSFFSNMVGTVITHAETSVAAINALTKSIDPSNPQPFDAIFLDFDLNQEEEGRNDLDVYINGRGSDVTDWILSDSARSEKFGETLFVLHTLNRWGSELMYNSLNDSQLSVIKEPFAWKTMTPDILEKQWIVYLKTKKESL